MEVRISEGDWTLRLSIKFIQWSGDVVGGVSAEEKSSRQIRRRVNVFFFFTPARLDS